MNSQLSGCWRWTLTAVAILLPCLAGASIVSAAESGHESIGDQLLEDLDPSLFSLPADSPDDSVLPGDEIESRKRILPGMIDNAPGKDLGAPSTSAPLAVVVNGMTSAATLVRGDDTVDEAAGQQREVVAELDKLIEQLSKQCSGGACQGEQPKPQSKRSQHSASKAGAKPGRGTAPARESSSQLRQADPGAVNLAEREKLMKDLWGHLPPQVREQMLESSSDEFLPEYAEEIEAYFQTLAEESAQEPGNRHAE
jgi:hypothetical protein